MIIFLILILNIEAAVIYFHLFMLHIDPGSFYEKGIHHLTKIKILLNFKILVILVIGSGLFSFFKCTTQV